MSLLSPKPSAQDLARCKGMLSRLLNLEDPTAREKGQKVRAKRVVRVYDADPRGLVEVLFITPDDQPMTAWLTSDVPARAELVSLEDGF